MHPRSRLTAANALRLATAQLRILMVLLHPNTPLAVTRPAPQITHRHAERGLPTSDHAATAESGEVRSCRKELPPRDSRPDRYWLTTYQRGRYVAFTFGWFDGSERRSASWNTPPSDRRAEDSKRIRWPTADRAIAVLRRRTSWLFVAGARVREKRRRATHLLRSPCSGSAPEPSSSRDI